MSIEEQYSPEKIELEVKKRKIETDSPKTEIIGLLGSIPDTELEAALMTTVENHFKYLEEKPNYNRDVYRIKELVDSLWESYRNYKEHLSSEHKELSESLDEKMHAEIIPNIVNLLTECSLEN